MRHIESIISSSLKNDDDDEIREISFDFSGEIFIHFITFIYYFVIIKVNNFTAFREENKILLFFVTVSHLRLFLTTIKKKFERAEKN